jgi:hypothetical protein
MPCNLVAGLRLHDRKTMQMESTNIWDPLFTVARLALGVNYCFT